MRRNNKIYNNCNTLRPPNFQIVEFFKNVWNLPKLRNRIKFGQLDKLHVQIHGIMMVPKIFDGYL